MSYCLYLRKSRADAEAEARGEGETLARHERTLLELAKIKKIVVTEIYRELVSGDTIASRPVMQRLLQEVGQGVWEGVLVMEVERLARGDTIDQGIVAQTFKFSGTKIITPLKDYDPSNEYDEEYFEFGLFMSRREYKTINRRLQRGKLASVKEGKYVGNIPPYGYCRVRITDGKGFTLAPEPEEAEVVQLIFRWYTEGMEQSDGSVIRPGAAMIASRLNALKIPSRKGRGWFAATIRAILDNPVYIGKLRWNHRKCVKKMVDGKVEISRPLTPKDCIVVDGLHPPIISVETFNLAQEYISKIPPAPVPAQKTIKNPLAGLVICGKCGRRMIRRGFPNGKQSDCIMCPSRFCGNVSAPLYLVEKRILDALAEWAEQFTISWDIKPELKSGLVVEQCRKAVARQERNLDTLRGQLDKTHDLLEQGVYNTDTFLSRSRLLSEKISAAEDSLKNLKSELEIEINRQNNAVNIIPRVKELLSVYNELSSPQVKNDLLKKVLEKVVYTKDSDGGRHRIPDNFEIHIYPKIPNDIEAAPD